jgi:hypothetical protein
MHMVLLILGAPWGEAKTANKPGREIAEDVAVEIGHDEHVKLVGVLGDLQCVH